MVILADFILEFRFEYLWPFWLLLRSVYDSFKYQGLVSWIQFTGKSATFIDNNLHLFYFTGLFCIFYLYCTNFWHDLFLLYTSTLALFCSQYICLGAVYLAHRCVHIIHLQTQKIIPLNNQYFWMIHFLIDKGVCLPTVMLWLLFLYIEAAVRLRDLRHMPFHLDLCRPFAAHW